MTLDGVALPCNADDGFRVLDERTLGLSGAACQQWKSGEPVNIDVRFPCEVHSPE